MNEKQIGDFLAGPPYLPFGWMGCLDGWGGPLPQNWIDAHAELQQKILARQRQLGMTPVLQGFTGHVPAALGERYPDARLHRIHWIEWDTCLLDPFDPLFSKVAGLFSVTVSEFARKYVFYVLGPIILIPFISMLFFIIYYFVPNGKVDASQTVFTSIATALLWMIAMFGFWLALPLLDFKGSYYKLASLMALVTWVFISSFILILGANLSAHKVLPEAWTGYLPFRKRAAMAGAEAQRSS